MPLYWPHSLHKFIIHYPNHFIVKNNINKILLFHSQSRRTAIKFIIVVFYTKKEDYLMLSNISL